MLNATTNKYLETSIKNVREQLDQKRETFDIMVQNELYSDNPNFETDAIAILGSMAKVKAELQTLEGLRLVARSFTN